eukprot:scaffold596_cov378-Prasinococcus_capsulatus_cf.AAC.2
MTWPPFFRRRRRRHKHRHPPRRGACAGRRDSGAHLLPRHRAPARRGGGTAGQSRAHNGSSRASDCPRVGRGGGACVALARGRGCRVCAVLLRALPAGQRAVANKTKQRAAVHRPGGVRRALALGPGVPREQPP